MHIDRFACIRISLATALLAVAGCTTQPLASGEASAACRAFYADLDRQVERAGVRDGGERRVAGYPYLRTDRFLASFAEDTADAAAFDAWVLRLRALDQAARAAELRNLGHADTAKMLDRGAACGAQLAALELATPAQRARLRERVNVPDDYSLLARGLGFYPFAVPFLNLGIAGYHDEVRADYARPLAALDSPGPLTVWTPAVSSTARAAVSPALPRDALGVPQLSDAQWQQLAERHAPIWWIEHGGAHDRPGALRYGADGIATVDIDEPVAYFRGDYTRFGREVLPTLSYVLWFAERPAQKSFDPYAGALDGLIWRVVLDPQGEPLVYDTIHPCGCYRYTFPAQPLQRVEQGGFWQEPVLFPQDTLPAGRPALRIQSQTHYLRRVVSESALSGERRTYSLRPYAELLTLADGRGGTRSLFAGDGIVDGSLRTERWWLWITGVFEPGAMRQWGRHATAFVGRSHFDDARFLEQDFAVPEWAR